MITVEKGSELPKFLPNGTRNPDRKYKGRAVFDGRRGIVKGENWNVALFQELSSSPAAMEDCKVCDALGLQPGWCLSQADAEQAYTQAKLGGIPTWVRLPKSAWPKE